MSDPAIEAALRAWIKPRGSWAREYFDPTNRLESALTDAAREALAPLRELHRIGVYGYCKECGHEGGRWPCDSAKLIYPESEL